MLRAETRFQRVTCHGTFVCSSFKVRETNFFSDCLQMWLRKFQSPVSTKMITNVLPKEIYLLLLFCCKECPEDHISLRIPLRLKLT